MAVSGGSESPDKAGEGVSEFISQYAHSLDAKGRLIIPARYREELDEEARMTVGLDHCLFIFKGKDWQVLVQKLNAIPISNRNGRKFARFLMSNAFPCEMDRQGRMIIPPVLREYAGLEKDVILAGVGSRIEIWDRAAWTETVTYDDMDEIAGNMEELGI